MFAVVVLHNQVVCWFVSAREGIVWSSEERDDAGGGRGGGREGCAQGCAAPSSSLPVLCNAPRQFRLMLGAKGGPIRGWLASEQPCRAAD